jgi:hypothetical protein
MDWQQLQSLYNQKNSVNQTGQLTSETNDTTLQKSSVQIIPSMSHRSHLVRSLLIAIVITGMLSMLVVLFMQYRSKKMISRTAITTETIKTDAQIRNDMISEIVADQRENAIPPQELNRILLGSQADSVTPVE